MGFTTVKKLAYSLFEEASYISQINDNSEYEKALALMDELIKDYDKNALLIGILIATIRKREDELPEFAVFNNTIKKLDAAEAVLRVLMEQHKLGVADLPEIGSKSLVSRILNRERRLTKDHIETLCKRFNVSPELFFNQD